MWEKRPLFAISWAEISQVNASDPNQRPIVSQVGLHGLPVYLAVLSVRETNICHLLLVLINGPEERTIPGNALSVHPDLPFRGLERFGVSFLSRFEGSQMPSSVLRSVNLVDTPGVLSGEKQRTNRGYDFTKVVAWFAEVSRESQVLCLSEPAIVNSTLPFHPPSMSLN